MADGVLAGAQGGGQDDHRDVAPPRYRRESRGPRDTADGGASAGMRLVAAMEARLDDALLQGF